MWRLGRKTILKGAAILCVTLIGGCDALPASGPSAAEINQTLAEPAVAARVRSIEVTPETVGLIGRLPDALPPPAFRGSTEPTIGVGDVISITVFEAAAGGLFSGAASTTGGSSSKSVTLPPMTVSKSGQIDVPYVGTVNAAGQTFTGLQQLLADRLQGRAIQPQVVVSMVTNVANTVTITGAVKTPGRYGLSGFGESAIDVIALAGGAVGGASDTLVQWQSSSRIYRIYMDVLLKQRRGAIQVRPGDHLHVLLEPRSYLVFGAALRNGEYKIETSEVNLAEAVARSGGLLDVRADSRFVYVFRYEHPAVVRRILGIETAPVTAASSRQPLEASTEEPVSVIYRLNMKRAEGFLISQRFAVRSKDLIYIPNADSVQWQKFLDLLRVVAQPITSGVTVAQ